MLTEMQSNGQSADQLLAKLSSGNSKREIRDRDQILLSANQKMNSQQQSASLGSMSNMSNQSLGRANQFNERQSLQYNIEEYNRKVVNQRLEPIQKGVKIVEKMQSSNVIVGKDVDLESIGNDFNQ